MHPHEVFYIFLLALCTCRHNDGFKEVASRSEERQDRGSAGLSAVCRNLDGFALQVGDCAMEDFVSDRSCENSQHRYAPNRDTKIDANLVAHKQLADSIMLRVRRGMY